MAALLVSGCVLGALLLLAVARPPLPDVRGRPLPSTRREPTPRIDAAMVLDLVAAAVEAGAPPSAALAAVAACLPVGPGGRPAGAAADLGRAAEVLAAGAEPAAAWDGASRTWHPLQRALALSEATGAPVASLLRDAAEEVRRARRRAASLAAARLGVRVVAPLGLCALPGFALLGVAPVVLGLAGELLAG